MNTESNYEYEQKNIFDWTPYDYLQWIKNIQECEKSLGRTGFAFWFGMMADGLSDRIAKGVKEKNV